MEQGARAFRACARGHTAARKAEAVWLRRGGRRERSPERAKPPCAPDGRRGEAARPPPGGQRVVLPTAHARRGTRSARESEEPPEAGPGTPGERGATGSGTRDAQESPAEPRRGSATPRARRACTRAHGAARTP